MKMMIVAGMMMVAGVSNAATPAQYPEWIQFVNGEAAKYAKVIAGGGERMAACADDAAKALARENLRYPVAYCPNKTLTGNIADWDRITAVGNISRPVGNNIKPLPEDLQVSFKCCMSGKAIYFLLMAKDAHVSHGLSKFLRYNNDCFEIYLDPTLSRSIKAGDHTAQTFVTPDDKDGKAMVAQGKFPVKAIAVPFEGGWAAEVAFPLENEYFDMKPFDGLTFGANVMYCNNDTVTKATCDHKLGWSALDLSDNSYQTPGVYGLFTVVMPEKAPVVPVGEGPKIAEKRAQRASGATIDDPAVLGAERPVPAITRGFNANNTVKTLTKAAAWGADSVRIDVVSYGLCMKYRKQPRSALTNLVDEACAAFVETCARCRKLGLKFIPTMGTGGIPMFNRQDDGYVWAGGELERAYTYLWKRIVEVAQPHKDVIWGFDILNEPLEFAELPYAPTRLRGFYERLIPELRKIDATSWIIYETGAGGGWEGFQDLKPLPDRHIIYSCHYYQPGAFTHQGVNASLLQDAALTPKAQESNALRYPDYYFGRWFDRDEMERILAPVIAFQRTYDVPIYIGEFSVTSWSPVDSSVQWLKDCTSIFEKYGWSWSYHCIDGWTGWNLDTEDGVILNPKHCVESMRKPVILDLMKK